MPWCRVYAFKKSKMNFSFNPENEIMKDFVNWAMNEDVIYFWSIDTLPENKVKNDESIIFIEE